MQPFLPKNATVNNGTNEVFPSEPACYLADTDILNDGFNDLALAMGREQEDYDSDAAYEYCCLNLMSDAARALEKFNIVYDKDTCEFIQKSI